MIDRGFSLVEQNSRELDALVQAFKISRGQRETANPCGGVLVITGAGCSVSAGIPAAAQIAQKCAIDLWCKSGYTGSCDELGDTLEAQAKAAVVNLARQGRLPNYLADERISELPWNKLYEVFFLSSMTRRWCRS
jgi:hypothetical protein